MQIYIDPQNTFPILKNYISQYCKTILFLFTNPHFSTMHKFVNDISHDCTIIFLHVAKLYFSKLWMHMKGVVGVPGVAESSAICSNLLLSAVYLHFLHRNSFLCIFPLMNFSIVLIWEIWHLIFWSVLMGEGGLFLYICHFYGFRFYQQQMCKKKIE